MIDRVRVRRALARLGELVARFPALTAEAQRERLARTLDDARKEGEGGNDGNQEENQER